MNKILKEKMAQKEGQTASGLALENLSKKTDSFELLSLPGSEIFNSPEHSSERISQQNPSNNSYFMSQSLENHSWLYPVTSRNPPQATTIEHFNKTAQQIQRFPQPQVVLAPFFLVVPLNSCVYYYNNQPASFLNTSQNGAAIANVKLSTNPQSFSHYVYKQAPGSLMETRSHYPCSDTLRGGSWRANNDGMMINEINSQTFFQ